jgi:hypothetical protein
MNRSQVRPVRLLIADTSAQLCITCHKHRLPYLGIPRAKITFS